MMGKTFYGSPSLIRPLICNEKIDLTREVATLNWGKFSNIYYFISFEIGPDMKDDLVGGALKERGYCICNKTFTLSHCTERAALTFMKSQCMCTV
jgi:hypothetical protein